MHDFRSQMESPRLALRLAFGLVPLLAGLDKFTNLLTDWSRYVPASIAQILPLPVPEFLAIIGIVEIAVGLMVLTRWPVLGSYLAAAWLLLISVNLVIAGYYDVAVRDVVLAIAAFTHARLAEPSWQPSGARSSVASGAALASEAR
ncbi:MAG TPA: hypothetical protein VEB21_14390 [Terriglobales bacterium]|nr:hypothetical protein [Terriglobales bacterium]